MTRTLISAWTDGRPPVGRMESLVQLLAEATLLPPQDGVGGHDHEGPSPPGPNPGEPYPEEAIRRAKLRPGRRPLVHGELLAQGKVLEGEQAMAAEEEGEEPKQVEQGSDHRRDCGRIRTDRSTHLPAGRGFGEGQARGPHPSLGDDSRE